MKSMPANRSFYSRAKYNNKKKTTTEPLKEGVTTIFRVVHLYTGRIFCDNFILIVMIRFTGMNTIITRPP